MKCNSSRILYCFQMIDYYDDLSFFIDTLPNIEYFPMFAVSCSEIKEILVQAAKNHRNYVLDFVAKQNKEINLKYQILTTFIIYTDLSNACE